MAPAVSQTFAGDGDGLNDKITRSILDASRAEFLTGPHGRNQEAWSALSFELGRMGRLAACFRTDGMLAA